MVQKSTLVDIQSTFLCYQRCSGLIFICYLLVKGQKNFVVQLCCFTFGFLLGSLIFFNFILGVNFFHFHPWGEFFSISSLGKSILPLLGTCGASTTQSLRSLLIFLNAPPMLGQDCAGGIFLNYWVKTVLEGFS